ncbi:Dimeric alpha+beta barrel [Glarea lozoyensis ATCC 20868]|uniref:Dimeric alpha+beta barrel n=1 Tax=Glarea lozoyensis (strain ATCC 20868 / MF5171) TaxID=1116229 RepID=S3CU22_GLAL2|nr:Dimeric alpha+beta barrel [Glarea lozoyensis ATCC 20868]EPE28524.1 Dimeric alpha+beta barrel [Glarea lozoyensis ATCC 20868]
MTLVHIVLFEFKPTTEHEVIQDVCRRMLALKADCVHPRTNRPYILESSGGRDNSPEGHQGGFSHGFVSHFASEEDRKYYLTEDPAHLAFVKSLDGIIQNVRVVDYEPGKY